MTKRVSVRDFFAEFNGGHAAKFLELVLKGRCRVESNPVPNLKNGEILVGQQGLGLFYSIMIHKMIEAFAKLFVQNS